MNQTTHDPLAHGFGGAAIDEDAVRLSRIGAVGAGREVKELLPRYQVFDLGPWMTTPIQVSGPGSTGFVEIL